MKHKCQDSAFFFLPKVEYLRKTGELWREEVVKSFKFLDNEDWLVKWKIDDEIRENLQSITFFLELYMEAFTLEDYVILRKTFMNINNSHVKFLEEAIITCISLKYHKPYMITSILDKLGSEKEINIENISGEVITTEVKRVEWYPFSKLEWQNIEEVDQTKNPSQVIKKKVRNRIYEPVNVMDSFKVCFEIYNHITKLVVEYGQCFCFRKEKINASQIKKFGIGKRCDSYDDAKRMIEEEGINDLLKEFDKRFSFLEERSYKILFGSIVSKMREERVYKGRVRSELEISLLKYLSYGFNYKGREQYCHSEVVKYVSDGITERRDREARPKTKKRKCNRVWYELHKPGK